MDLSVAVMVSVDKRDVYELFLPGISEQSFRGVSLAELLDDVALHLMENIPKEKASNMPLYQFCPHIQLRKVKVTVQKPIPGMRKKEPWTGRMTVVLRRWPGENFYIACVPRVGVKTFAVEKPSYLETGLARFLEKMLEKEPWLNLEDYVCRSYEYLEILAIDTELPSVLPSRQPQKKKKKKSKKKKKDKKKKGEKKKKDKKPKRHLIPPVTLREVGINLTHRAMDNRLFQAFRREALVEQLLTMLENEGSAILLVGPSGVGKTAIIHEVIRRLAAENKPIQERTDVWEVDGNRLISGMSLVGAWEQRCHDMVHELSAREDILYVDDLPALVFTGRSAHSDTNVAEYLEPHLSRSEFRIIGECTPERLEATREEAPGFFSRFRVIQVPELSERDTLLVLVHAMRLAEAVEDVVISPEILEAVLALTRRFLVHSCYPGKAITLLRRLIGDSFAAEGERNIDEFGRRVISRKDLISFFARQTGLPDFVLWEQGARSFFEVRKYFERRIVAQEAAVDAVSDVVAVLQKGLNDPERPLSTLLFVGPTGVGKTETAKALAQYLFGRSERLLRFDMSEFMEPWSVTRLFGDRHQPDGELTRKIQQQPFSVVLFDEIEKAHPSVFDTLLQVLGEGRLTNAAGRTVDFCNTVVIMTSNLGVKEANHHLGFSSPDQAQHDAHFKKAAEGFFRPEFFNRIDRIVPFRSLGREAIAPLVRRLLQEVLGRRGLRHSSVLVQVDPDLVELLIEQGFEPRYGARSMKRLLEQRLTVPLARHLVSTPLGKSTLIFLFRYGNEIGMEIWPLIGADYELLLDVDLAENWREIPVQYELLQGASGNFQDDVFLKNLQEERTTLLEAFNESSLSEVQHERLISLSEWFDEGKELVKDIEWFEEEYLASFRFDERKARKFEHTEGKEHLISGRLRYSYIEQTPVAVERAQVFPLARKALFDLRTRTASHLYRYRVFHEHDERPLLLRFLPATDDDTACRWALQLAFHFSRCWSRWASTKGFMLTEDGWHPIEETLWRKPQEELLDEDARASKYATTSNAKNTQGNWEEDSVMCVPVLEGGWIRPDSPWRDVRGAAVEFQGPGLFELVEAELGFYLHAYHVGPDKICDLVRVEEVGELSVEPVEQLTRLDQKAEAYLQKRRSGVKGDNPLPELPIVRSFLDRVDEDLQSGKHVQMHRLAHDLFQVAMMRLFSKFVEEVS